MYLGKYTKPDIVYATTKNYDLIATDAGSGANRDVAFWSVSNHQPDYCSLGDIATPNLDKPGSSAILLKKMKDDALAKPWFFFHVWIDKGSGADTDIAIYQMWPQPGYTCLGNFLKSS